MADQSLKPKQDPSSQPSQLEALRAERDDLKLMLDTTIDHGDAVQAQLSESNAHLATEIRERRRAEARIETLVRSLREKVRDYELLVEILSEHADAIDAARDTQLSSLESQAMSDSLTGLANRRALDQALIQHWRERHLHVEGLSILLVDIDFFKLYNDSYGHQEGDACLTRVAQCMSETLSRPADLVARYGGEEFCVILPGTSEEGALGVARRLVAAVSGMQILHAKSPFHHVTISVGSATYFRALDETALAKCETLQARADAALYEAKQRGRNRFCKFERSK